MPCLPALRFRSLKAGQQIGMPPRIAILSATKFALSDRKSCSSPPHTHEVRWLPSKQNLMAASPSALGISKSPSSEFAALAIGCRARVRDGAKGCTLPVPTRPAAAIKRSIMWGGSSGRVVGATRARLLQYMYENVECRIVPLVPKPVGAGKSWRRKVWRRSKGTLGCRAPKHRRHIFEQQSRAECQRSRCCSKPRRQSQAAPPEKVAPSLPVFLPA